MTRQVKAISLCLLFLSLLTFPAFSQSKIDQTIVGSVGKEKVTYGELKDNLNLNSGKVYSLKELEDFLLIYLEYKAKIKFAEDEGLFDAPELTSELELYAKQASYSYWLNNRIKATEFDHYYKRASTEVKSEHILISVSPNAPPSDTLIAYKKLIEARNKFLNGVSMSQLDLEYSTKQNGQSMGGDLTWFSIGTMIKEFEDVIYTLEKGEISMPFRTQFGYHVVHLQDKRPRTLSREISHIFASAGVKESKDKIYQAYQDLLEGDSWGETAAKYSDDNLTASNNGTIGWINYGRYKTEFIDSVMALNPELDYSPPIKTSYGYHIFRIDSIQTFNSDEEQKDAYMKEFFESSNFTKSNEYVINWIQKNITAQLFKKNLEAFKDYINLQNTLKLVDISYSYKEALIYQIKNFSFSTKDYFDYLAKKYPTLGANKYSDKWIANFLTYAIDSVIVNLTISEFPEFRSVVDNYKKGLAVYQVNDTYFWNSATVDTSKLKEIYKTNPRDYVYPNRHHYYLLRALADSTLDKAVNYIRSGHSPDSVRSNSPRVAVSSDSTTLGKDTPFDKLESVKSGSFSEKFDYNQRRTIFYLNTILSPRAMTFEESFNRILSEYQPTREKKWLRMLKKNYNVKSDTKKLRSIFKRENSAK